MTQKEILTQIDELKELYWNCRDEDTAARLENEMDYFYALLEQCN